MEKLSLVTMFDRACMRRKLKVNCWYVVGDGMLSRPFCELSGGERHLVLSAML